jgi:hypothetical protein
MSIQIALSGLRTNGIRSRLALRSLSTNPIPYAGNGTVGIVREQYGINQSIYKLYLYIIYLI